MRASGWRRRGNQTRLPNTQILTICRSGCLAVWLPQSPLIACGRVLDHLLSSTRAITLDQREGQKQCGRLN
eukprot:scaffold6634_cov229-Ochromonas_danica.AAC.10